MSSYTFTRQRKRNFLLGFSLTNNLILINVLLYFVSLVVLGIYGESFLVDNFALTPNLVLSGEKVWTLLTSIFLHGSFFHLFANMFSLFFIGNFLEKIIGRKRFVKVYFASGLVGGIFFIIASLLFNSLNVPAVGASGAIFGILGVLAVLIPYSKIYLIVGPLVVIFLSIILESVLPASFIPIFSFLLNLLIILMIFSLLSFNKSFRKIALPLELPMWLLPIIAIVPLSLISILSHYNSSIPRLPIGNSAHFGGLVIGIIYGFYLRNKFPNKTKRLRSIFR